MANEVDIEIVVSDSAVDPALAALRAKIGAWAKTLPHVSILDFNAGAIDAQLSMIKSKLQAHKIADLLDVNLNPGQIESQLLYLKRKIEAYKISDLLDINLNAGQLQAQMTALSDVVGKNPITIPVSLDVDLSELIALEGMSFGVGVNGASNPVFDIIARNTADASASLMHKVALEIEMNSILASGFESVVRAINNNGDMLSHDMIMLRAFGGGGGSKVIVPPNPGGGGGGGGGGWGGWGWWRWLGGGSIAGIAAWHIALDGLLEALIAVVSALAAFAVGAAALQPTLHDIYTNIQSINVVNSAFGDQIKVTGDSFRNLSESGTMAARGVSLYGGALILVNRNTGILNQVAMRVTSTFDTWIAKIVVWDQTSQTFGKLLKDGVGFMQQFGQMAGNLGDALFNLIKAMPGVAHYLMDILVAATKVFDIFTKIPTPILAFVLALHGIYVWGRLGIGILLSLGVRLGIVSAAARDSYRNMTALALIRNPFTWAVAAAIGIGFLIHRITEVKPAISSMISNINNQLGSMSASQAMFSFGGISDQIVKLEGVMKRMPADQSSFALFKKALTPNQGWAQNWHATEAAFRSFFTQGFAPKAIFGSSTTNSIAAVREEISKLQGSGMNLSMTLASTMAKGYGFTTALGIMDLAGVKANDTFTVMKQKVNDLLTGYRAMGVSGGILANSVNAVNFAALQQQSQIATLTAGWTAFFSTLISGEQGFVSFAQALEALNPALKAVHGNLTGLSTKSITARSDFLAAAQAAQTQANNLMTMAAAAGLGAHGTDLVNQSVKDMVARMLPAAKGSASLTTILYGLAQQGGYRAANSFQALSHWADNVKHPMKNLDSITAILTGDMGNLLTDVTNLSVALGKNLTQAEANAITQATNLQPVLLATAKALFQGGTNSQGFTKSLKPLAVAFLENSNNAQTAHQRFDAFLIMMGLNKQQADALWKSISTLATKIAALHDKHFAVSETATGSGHYSITGPGAAQVNSFFGKQKAATGWLVPGYGGGDKWPVLVEGGETIVPKELTPVVAGLMKAHGVRGFAQGGFVGQNAAGNIGLGNWTTGSFNNFTGSFANQFASNFSKDLVGATVAAQKAASAAAMRMFITASHGASGGNGGNIEALARRMFPWPSYMWTDFTLVENREAGWNMFARNPGSGAYGLAQFINGPSEYYQWGGNPNTAAGQLVGMFNYIRSRYGTPLAAWGHEMNFGWYGKGLRNGLFTRPTVIGVGERGPERVSVTPVGQGSNDHHVLEVVPGGAHLFEQFMAQFIKKYVRTKGGGDVSEAFKGYR